MHSIFYLPLWSQEIYYKNYFAIYAHRTDLFFIFLSIKSKNII